MFIFEIPVLSPSNPDPDPPNPGDDGDAEDPRNPGDAFPTFDNQIPDVNIDEDESNLIVEVSSDNDDNDDSEKSPSNPPPDPGNPPNPQIPDVNVDEDADDLIIEVSSDSGDDEITILVLNNSNPELVAISINGNSLNLDFLDNQFGTTDITILVTANGESQEETFTVTVNPVDDSPELVNSISDLIIPEEIENQTIDLSNVFRDPDGDEITLSVQNNSNPEIVSAVLDGSDLNLEVLDDQFGSADITVQATANGQSVDETFSVTVNSAIDNNLINPIYRFQSNQIPGTFLFVTEQERQNINLNLANGFIEEGIAFNAAIEPDDELIPLFRFQSTQRPGTYLFAAEEERNNINSDPNLADSFTEEGISFYVYGVGAGEETPFFRFQNSLVPGTYLYATGAEADNIRVNFPNFIEEGIAFEARI